MLEYGRLHDAILGLRDKQIFFIGGTIKSGTTWLQLLLDAHPAISCRGEGHFINHLAPLLKTTFQEHCDLIAKKNASIFQQTAGYPAVKNEAFLYILASCVSVFLIEQSKPKIVQAIGEKTPDNVRHFGTLNMLFPKAKFIHIVRDGRDCAVSGWFHNQRITPAWLEQKFGSIESFAAVVATQWAADLGKVEEFASQYPDRVHQLRYEDLVAEPEATLAVLFRFLGVESNESLLAGCRDAASFTLLSGGRNPGEEDRNSFFRKGVPGDWRCHLGDAAAAKFQDVAGRWLERFGYAAPSSATPRLRPSGMQTAAKQQIASFSRA